jgi:hypothetical protein
MGNDSALHYYSAIPGTAVRLVTLTHSYRNRSETKTIFDLRSSHDMTFQVFCFRQPFLTIYFVKHVIYRVY